MKHENVLVTGGSGLLGRFVVAAFEGRCNVSVLDLKPPVQDVHFHQADITDLQAVRAAMRGMDAVVHLAGYDDGDAPEETDYVRVNLSGAWNVLLAAEEVGVKVLAAASSTAATGIGRDNPPDYLPIDEDHPLRPRRAYDVAKQAMEVMGEAFSRRSPMRVAMLRPTLIVRPEKAPEMIAELNDAGEDQGIAVDAPHYGGLPAYRAWISSRDCAAAFAAALDADFGAYDRFFIAADDTLGGIDALANARAVAGRGIELGDSNRFEVEANASTLDNRHAKSVLGWTPRDSWKDIVGLVAAGATSFESWTNA